MKATQRFFGVIAIALGSMPAPAWASSAPGVDAQNEAELLNPSEVISPQDYPVQSMRAGEEGTVGVKLFIDAGGVLLDCQVVQSSGHKALDEQTCTSFRTHGKFHAVGHPNDANGRFSVTTRVTWQIPVDGPRPLLLGVTLTGSEAVTGDRTRCSFSDGRVLSISKGEKCVLDLPTQTLTEGAVMRSVNIVDHYNAVYDKDHKSSDAFNLAVILATYQYAQSIDYLIKASDSGLSIASLITCGLYGTPKSFLRDMYDPKEAVRRCVLADKQGLGLGVNLARQIIAASPEVATPEIKQYLDAHSSGMPVYTTAAVLTIPGDQLVRTQDYPKDALKQKIQGRTVALFEVNSQGRVGDCLVVQSSLSFSLDQTVCRRLVDGAIYTPATSLGQATPMWMVQPVTWQIGKNGSGFGQTLFGALLGALVGHAIP
jgi:TonB family protein